MDNKFGTTYLNFFVCCCTLFSVVNLFSFEQVEQVKTFKITVSDSCTSFLSKKIGRRRKFEFNNSKSHLNMVVVNVQLCGTRTTYLLEKPIHPLLRPADSWTYLICENFVLNFLDPTVDIRVAQCPPVVLFFSYRSCLLFAQNDKQRKTVQQSPKSFRKLDDTFRLV